MSTADREKELDAKLAKQQAAKKGEYTTLIAARALQALNAGDDEGVALWAGIGNAHLQDKDDR